MTKTLREAWEARAVQLEGRLASVLFKGLDDRANAVLHDWHVALVRNTFLPCLGHKAHILDLGCGYGRMASVLRDGDSSRFVVGQDFSFNYCRLFREGAGPSTIQANLTDLPFREHAFDGCIAITSLMYLDTNEVTSALAEVARVLRPGGYFLLVDPGEELRHLLKGLSVKSGPQTGGHGFFRSMYKELVSQVGLELISCGGNQKDTARILLSLGGHRGWQFWSRWIPRSDVRDKYTRLSLHRWILARAPFISG